MDFLLNERSLHGQFENGKVFLESLGPVMECIRMRESIRQRLLGNV